MVKSDIERELRRICSGEGVEVIELDSHSRPGWVRLSTARTDLDLPADQLLPLLRRTPDGIGVPALRKLIEEHIAHSEVTDG
jgi:hypothetical protein